MITKINNSTDAITAFNENLEGILTGKRKLLVAKEVNNSVGKICGVIKMQLIEKHLTGDKSETGWFNKPKQIPFESSKKLKKAL